jgi:uncharacterized delta-60 repeat protein
MAVDVQPDGKLSPWELIRRAYRIVRLKYGDLDTTFAGDGTLDWYNGYGRDVVVQPDGKILVLHSSGLMRFLPDGSFDASGRTTTDFSNGTDRAWAATVAPDGKIILAGESTPPSSSRKSMALARFNSDGTPDLSFDGNGRTTATFIGEDAASDVAVYPDGSIIAAGFTRRTNFDFAVFASPRWESTKQRAISISVQR